MMKKEKLCCWIVVCICVVFGVLLTDFTGIFRVAKHTGTGSNSKEILSSKHPSGSMKAEVPLRISIKTSNSSGSSQKPGVQYRSDGHSVFTNSILPNDGKVRNCISGKVIYVNANEDTAHNKLRSYTSLSLSNRSKSETLEDRKSSFKNVFQKKLWGGERLPAQSEAIRGSGPGSTLDFSQEAIGTLHALINAMKKKLGKDKISFLDIPCGDMAWISRFLDTRDDIIYTGMDIVPEIIEHHQRVYRNYNRYKFISADILDNNVQLERYDLILSRMMMQHLFDTDVQKLLKKISQSGSKYILMTTFVHLSSNQNLGNTLSYRFRPQNLQIPPFSLTSPVCLQRDGPPHKEDHYLGLWELPLQSINNCNVQMKTTPNLPNRFYVC